MISTIILFLIVIIISISILWIKNKDKQNLIQVEKFLTQNHQQQLTNTIKKPILWIYHELDMPNTRYWDSFGSRLNLGNTPSYLWLSIYSIYVNCFRDFHIIILNSKTIYQYLPNLKIDMSPYSTIDIEKRKQYISCYLLERYGGIYLEPSTIVLKNLYPLYQKYILTQQYQFVGFAEGDEYILGNTDNTRLKPSMKIMMSGKNNMLMKQCRQELYRLITNYNKISYQFNHYQLCVLWKYLNHHDNTLENKKYLILSPSYNGTRDKNNKLITIDNFLSTNSTEFLNHHDLHVVLLPDKALYENIKYNWFIRYSISQILNSNLWINDIYTKALKLPNHYYYTPSKDKVCSYHLRENCNCQVNFGRLQCKEPELSYHKIKYLNQYEPISSYQMPPISEKELISMLYQCNYFSTPPWLQVYNSSTPNV